MFTKQLEMKTRARKDEARQAKQKHTKLESQVASLTEEIHHLVGIH